MPSAIDVGGSLRSGGFHAALAYLGRSPQKMVALNTQEGYSEIFLRYGQVPLGQNPHAKPSLEEITLPEGRIPAGVAEVLRSDDVFSLAESYGDPVAGDPATFDFLRITLNNGRKKEIEVFNMAIMMFMDNREETRRVFRIINAIKGESGPRD